MDFDTRSAPALSLSQPVSLWARRVSRAFDAISSLPSFPIGPVKKAWRAKPSLAELKLVIVDIALGYPQAQERPETRPSFEEVWIKLRAHFETEIPRDDVRKALDVAPHLKRGRGQHGKSQS